MSGIERVPLLDRAYNVRSTQAVLQYGVGAMVDFPKQTMVTADGKLWEKPDKIYDERLAKSLGVDYFGFPKRVAYSRFPEWYFCPGCRKLKPLHKWIEDYKRSPKKIRGSNLDLLYHPICANCQTDLVVTRLVTVCENGHLNDFPWVEWVHARSNKPVCSNPRLKIKTSTSGSEGLDGIIVTCECKASTTLSGALEKDCFKNLQQACQTKGLGMFQKLCSGYQPQKLSYESQCNCKVRAFQRGASAVYFPQTISSLVIPPYTQKLNQRIENCGIIERIKEDIEDEGKEFAFKNLDGYIKKTFRRIEAEESETLNNKIKEILLRKVFKDIETPEPTSLEYRLQEYGALTGKTEIDAAEAEDFVRKSIPIEKYNTGSLSLPFVKSVNLITKIRVVKSLLGFSRVQPKTYKSKGFVSTRVQDGTGTWYPGVEVRGEGIFIEIEEDAIKEWIKENPEVIARIDIVNKNYKDSFIGQSHPRELSPKLVLLHTLSHMLIEQLSFDCGYSVSSLTERLYCADKENDGFNMAGIFIYTASGDSEGTLGGLVRLGYPDRLPKNFRRALEKAATCSNDPVCIMSKGQGLDALNLAACHACALLPETCCEERNVFLDRGLLVGTYDRPEIGFWSPERLKNKGLV